MQFASEDDAELAALGYVSSFKREFTNLATISFAFAIMVRRILYMLLPEGTQTIVF